MPDDKMTPTTPQPGVSRPVVEEVPPVAAPGAQSTQTPPPPPATPAGGGSPPANTPFGAYPAMDPTFGATSPQAVSNLPPVITPPSPRGGFPTKTVGIIVGILLLVGAVGAGIVLVQQQQDIREKASPADCYSVDLDGCTFAQNPSHCWRATTNNACPVNGVPDGTLEVFSGPGTFDGQVCYTCDANSDIPGQERCSAGTLIETNPACSSQPTAQPSTQPSATPYTNGICGDHCQTDSQCVGSSEYPQIRVGCRGGECVNLDCEEAGGTTIPGPLCACRGVAHSCGEPCGAGIGLCDSSLGVSCQYLSKSQCSPSTRWPICAPSGTTAGSATGPLFGVPQYHGASFESKKCGSGTGDPNNNYLWHPEFPNGMTSTQVADLICAGETPVNGGQCISVRVYDTNWNELTSTQLAQLQPGATIRITVAGSATTGAITQARFTFNGTLRSPVTQKKPDTQEFYDEVVIPTGATTVSIKGEVFHPDLGWF
jgi:hypothetical protein